MAALTSSNVRLIAAWTQGGLAGKRQKVKRVEVHGGSWGGTSNTMPASAFGFSVVEEVTVGIYGTGNRAYPLVPAPDGSKVYAFAAVGASSSPGDVTLAATPGGLYFTVKGY